MSMPMRHVLTRLPRLVSSAVWSPLLSGLLCCLMCSAAWSPLLSDLLCCLVSSAAATCMPIDHSIGCHTLNAHPSVAVASAQVRAFAPEAVFVNAGFDAHGSDPVASLALTDDDFAWLTAEIRDLGVPIVSVLEGGYNVEVLERSVRTHVRTLINPQSDSGIA